MVWIFNAVKEVFYETIRSKMEYYKLCQIYWYRVIYLEVPREKSKCSMRDLMLFTAYIKSLYHDVRGYSAERR